MDEPAAAAKSKTDAAKEATPKKSKTDAEPEATPKP